MDRRGAAVASLAAHVALGAALGLCAPPWPDDWDGLGLVASATRFDMDRFAPHPPGYPVYVVALRLAGTLLKPQLAAAAVSIAAGVATAWLAGDAARRTWGNEAAWPARLAVVASPAAWHAMSCVGTEALALSFAALVAWAAARPPERRARWAVAGVAIGLGTGVRLSWAPLYLAGVLLLPARLRWRVAALATAVTLAWAAVLAIAVGPAHLVRLYRVQAGGHFGTWGGTVATDSGPARVLWLLRDLFVDGLGAGDDPLGVAIVVVSGGLALAGLVAWRRRAWRGVGTVAGLALPYLLWISLGQNLRQQPRHALPLVALSALGLARAAAGSRRAKLAGLALALLVSARTARDAWTRRAVAPPGAQLVDLVRASPAPLQAAVFAGYSARFFEATELAGRAFSVGTLGDAMVVLTRLPALPGRVLVTGEVGGLEASAPPVRPVARLCRPARLDRRAPCLDVFEWDLQSARR